MRLIRCDIRGFRRFEKASINLDADLIAVVGPNEAGKTSLLQAMATIEADDRFSDKDITRGVDYSNEHRLVELRFLLNAEEQKLVDQVRGQGQPRWYVWGKRRNGTRYNSLAPRVARDRSPRNKAKTDLEGALASLRLKPLLSEPIPHTVDEDPPLTTPSLAVLMSLVLDGVNDDQETMSEDTLRDVRRLLDVLGSLQETVAKSSGRILARLHSSLTSVFETESAEHPNEAILRRLETARPEILLFTEGDRQLSSDYPTDVLSGRLPSALANLLDLAEVDLDALRRAIAQGDNGAREAIAEQANIVLHERFRDAWQQFRVFVRLQIDPSVIRILLPSAHTYSDIAERSDGLKSFVALYSFVSLKAGGVKPILLIDEAEAHLHYDAQADLVKVLETQNSAAQIVYTTHSAGCLPNDLGTGIRAVWPLIDKDGNDQGRSLVRNSVWTEGSGFSPLLLAMGASVLASVESRRAVYTEGLSDAILLPTLFRETLRIKTVGFQVLPGIAMASRRDIEGLREEFPRVAYLVDGDAGGIEHNGRLRASGVNEDDIVSLPEGLAVEDLVDPEAYVSAVNDELARSHGQQMTISWPDVQGRPMDFVDSWCARNQVQVPPKVKVATHLVEAAAQLHIANARRTRTIRRAYNSLARILDTRRSRIKP